MKVLGLQSLRTHRALRSGSACLAFWGSGVFALEYIGRQFESDFGDVVGVSLLVGYAAATWLWHVHRPLPPVERLVAAARTVGARLWDAIPEFGFDLRGEPPLPIRVPRAFVRATLVLAALVVALLACAGWFPSGARAAITPLSYTVYLAALAVLWFALIGGGFKLAAYPIGALHEAWLGAFTDNGLRARRVEWWSIGAYVVVLVLAIGALPGWIPLAGIGALLALDLAALHLPGNARLLLLWHEKDGEQEPRSLGMHQALALSTVLLGLTVACIGLVARGERLGVGLVPATSPSMPMTSFAGLVFLWCAFGGAAMGSVHVVRFVRRSRSLGGEAEPPELYVHMPDDGGVFASAVRSRVEISLVRANWRAEFAPAAPRPSHVQIAVQPDPAQPDPFALSERWPLALKPDDLDRPDVLRRLARRDVLLQRRQIVRGLEKLFKIAARRRFDSGNGFWLGLQHWFVPGLTRDADGDDAEWEQRAALEQIVGPPYHRLLSTRARRYYRDVMRDLHVDLIFVEDGLGFRRFRRALRVVFETHDIHGGKRRIEEMHFVGIPGVRAVIHDLGPGRPFRSSTYPEPEYEDIARARILHLFKDRGGEHDRVQIPDTFAGLPVPLSMA